MYWGQSHSLNTFSHSLTLTLTLPHSHLTPSLPLTHVSLTSRKNSLLFASCTTAAVRPAALLPFPLVYTQMGATCDDDICVLTIDEEEAQQHDTTQHAQ